MKRGSRRCMNIPDYFLGKPYPKVVSRSEQIKPNLFFARESEACTFMHHSPGVTPAEKSTSRSPCEIHCNHTYPNTPTAPNNDQSDRASLLKHCCGHCSPSEAEAQNPSQPKKSKGSSKNNQKPPAASIPTSLCRCQTRHPGPPASSMPDYPSYSPIPNIYGTACNHEHCHHPPQSPATNPACNRSHQPIEIPREPESHINCTCKRPNPTPRPETRPAGCCCCTDDAKSESSLDYALSDDSSSDSSTGAVVEDTLDFGKTKCTSCHTYQLVFCYGHGVLYGTK